MPCVGVGVCSAAAVVSPALFFSHRQGGLFASAAAAAAVAAVTAPASALSCCAQGHFWDGHMQDCSWCPLLCQAEGQDVQSSSHYKSKIKQNQCSRKDAVVFPKEELWGS